MDTETVFTASGNQFAQEDHFVIDLLHRNIVVLDTLERSLHLVQLMIMRGKQCLRTGIGMFVDIFDNRPGNRNTVVCACPASQFVKQDKTAGRHVVEDIRSLVHLHHESGFSDRNVIRSSHTCKYLIHNPDTSAFGWDETTDLRHQRNQSRLAKQSGLTGHVRSGDNDNLLLFIVQIDIIGNVRFADRQLFFNHRMAASLNIDHLRIIHIRTDITVAFSHLGK